MERLLSGNAPSLETVRGKVAEVAEHEDLHRLFESLMTLGNIASSTNGHPRFWVDRGANYTPGGRVLEALSEFIDHMIDQTVDHAKALPAVTKHDRDMKALTLAGWEVFRLSTPVEIIAAIAPLTTDTH